jgi:hypothetical protein
VEEGPRVSRAGQRDVNQVRSSGSGPFNSNVLIGRKVLRLGRSVRNISDVPPLGRETQRVCRRTKSAGSCSRRLEIGPSTLPANLVVPRRSRRITGPGLVRKCSEQPSRSLLQLQLRPLIGGCRRFSVQLEGQGSPLRAPAPDSGGQGSPEVASRPLSAFDSVSSSVAGSILVPDPAANASNSPPPSLEREVDCDGPAGSPGVADEVASHRMRFIWFFGERSGISKGVHVKRWSPHSSKRHNSLWR